MNRKVVAIDKNVEIITRPTLFKIVNCRWHPGYHVKLFTRQLCIIVAESRRPKSHNTGKVRIMAGKTSGCCYYLKLILTLVLNR